jgi:hypothetical protein
VFVRAVLIAGMLVACRPEAAAPSKPSGPPGADGEAWARLPFDRWPQLVLTNDAAFQGRTPLHGASGFLVRGPGGAIHLATARHLIGVNGGVQPDVAIAELDRVLVHWNVFPRTQPETSVDAAGVSSQRLIATDSDWLLLKTTGAPVKEPSYPLTLRAKPVAVGERVFMVGCPYSELRCRQNVYQGVVTARAAGTLFRFDIDPPVIVPGFSGAPILDEQGLVVGVVSIWFQPRTDGVLWLEAGGEDAAVAIPLLAD